MSLFIIILLNLPSPIIGGSGYVDINLEIVDTSSMELITSDLTLREGDTALFQVTESVSFIDRPDR